MIASIYLLTVQNEAGFLSNQPPNVNKGFGEIGAPSKPQAFAALSLVRTGKIHLAIDSGFYKLHWSMS